MILALSRLVRLLDFARPVRLLVLLPVVMEDELADLLLVPRNVCRTEPCVFEVLTDKREPLPFWAEFGSCEKCSKLLALLIFWPFLSFLSSLLWLGIFSLLPFSITPFCFFTRFWYSLSLFFWFLSTFLIRFRATFSASFFCLFARLRWCSICSATTRSRNWTQSSCPRAAASSRGVWYWLSKDQIFEPNFVKKTRQWNWPQAAATWTLVDPS